MPNTSTASNGIKSAIFTLAFLVAALLGVSVASAGSASAATIYAQYHATDDISARLTPTAAATALTGPYKGQTINVECQVIGEPVGPRGNTLYFQSTWFTGGANRTIYVPDTWTDSPHLAGQPPIAGIPLCGTSSGGGSGSGGGAPSGTYVSRTWQLRFCTLAGVAGCDPGTSAANRAPSIATNTSVTMVCYQDGVTATGDYTTNRWFWVRAANDVQGFVSASVVRNQTGVPNCNTSPNVTVAAAAASRSGQTTASAADSALFGAGEWAPGPVGEWAGDCPKLPYAAWNTVGVHPYKYNAIQNYNLYNNQGKIVHNSTISVGAIVYFNITTYGHTAIYLGAGMIATTTGLDGNRTPNAIAPISGYANYLGWIRPTN